MPDVPARRLYEICMAVPAICRGRLQEPHHVLGVCQNCEFHPGGWRCAGFVLGTIHKAFLFGKHPFFAKATGSALPCFRLRSVSA